ncbi:MAG: hypothetical protein WB489_22260 [Pseudolabrys sp.]
MSAFGGKADIIDPYIASPIIALAMTGGSMGYNSRNDEICDNITRMKREWEAQ